MSTTTPATGSTMSRPTRLRPHALGFPTLIAQSVAVISPTMTAVLIIATVFGNVGKGTWAAYAFGTVMLLLVVGGLNQFAKRSATAGSMYAYTNRGLGPVAGVMSGWTLIWSYLFISVVGLAGFSIFAGQLVLQLGGGHVSPFVFMTISGAACITIALKDIRLSSLLTLAFEAASVTCILALAGVILFKHGATVQTSQIGLQGVDLKGMGLAVVVCIFSLVGFESATTLGGEAKNATRNVPRAVIWSLIITGTFMVIMSYVEVFGASQTGLTLNTLTVPLNSLAVAYSVPFFRIPLDIGAMISFFSLSLSCLNAGARIMFPMGRHGFLPRRLHTVHETNLTPHVALAVYGTIIYSVAMILHAVGTSPNTIFNDAGTLAAFGFLTAYYLITVAAPFYLRKIGELSGRNVALAVLACVFLLVPLVGSFYPVPAWPVNIFPYIFLGYMFVGGISLYAMSRRQAGALAGIEADLERALDESVHAAFGEHEQAGTAPDYGYVPPVRTGTGVGVTAAVPIQPE